MKEIDTELSFSTDAWTSPNNKAYVAITVHFQQKGLPICLLLDIVEVLHSHSGTNLVKAFVQVLEDFGISEKVSLSLIIDIVFGSKKNLLDLSDPQCNL